MSLKENSQQQNSNSQEQIKSRRTLLKGAITGGVVAGGSALSTGWHKPIINSVILPAHATTSMPQGDFAATGIIPMALLNSPINSVQYALLNSLISPANATHIINGTCETDNDSGDDGDGLISIHFRITGTDVEIALTVESDSSPFDCNGGTSTLSATNTIADVSNIDITNGASVSLTNMQATATQVTGSWDIADNDFGDSDVTCSNTFTATIGGTFPVSVVCESTDS